MKSYRFPEVSVDTRWGSVVLTLTMLPFATRVHGQIQPLGTAVLTNIAVSHNMPRPSKEARLVLAHTGSWSVLGNRSTSRDPGVYSPAFLIEERKDGGISILRGTERESLEPRATERLWRPFSTEKIMPKPGGYVVEFGRLSAFVCAVQLSLRGEEATAQDIWRQFASSEHRHDDDGVGNVGERLKQPSLLLAECLFRQLRNEILQRPETWPGTQARLSALFEEFPSIKDTRRQEVFDDLTAAIHATQPKPDSVEALLLDWSRRPGRTRRYDLFEKGTEGDADAPARKIIIQGAVAVPELIGLLHDRRITVHELPAIMMAPARIRTVGELAGILLQEITGVETPTRWDKPDEEAFRKWLDQERDKGEQETVAASAFIRKDGRITGIKQGPVMVLAIKFPGRLAGLCSEFSANATSEAQPYSLAEAVVKSTLPKGDRIRVLTEFAQRGSLEHKRCVLQNLAELDQQRCAEVLVPILDNFPADSSGKYWTCPEAAFTHVVMQIEDDATWRRYLRVAKRSSIGLRMEIMNPLCYDYIGAKNRERRLAFAAAFLDDKALRDTSSNADKFDGPSAAFTFPKITVRDFAALKVASILRLGDCPDEFWTDAQWTALREKVGQRLAAEKLPDLGSDKGR